MQTLFDPAGRQPILDRLARLSPTAPRQWGKMDAGQMLAHCSKALSVAVGDETRKQALIGRILSPFVKASILGEKPFSRNSPTDPTFVMTGSSKEFEQEKQRLTELIDRFAAAGPEQAGRQGHSFFGKLTGSEWGVLMHKHLDHHLRQFGA
ncbi:MAG: DUF1569 domain-containing protein [Acidobacteriota bacterium]